MFESDKKNSKQKTLTNYIFFECRFLNLISKCFISSSIKRLEGKAIKQIRHRNNIKIEGNDKGCCFLWIVKCLESNIAFYKGL